MSAETVGRLVAAAALLTLAGCARAGQIEIAATPGEPPFPPQLTHAMCVDRVRNLLGPDLFGQFAINARRTAAFRTALERTLADHELLAPEPTCRIHITADLAALLIIQMPPVSAGPFGGPVNGWTAVIAYLVTDEAGHTLLWRPITTVCLASGNCGATIPLVTDEASMHADLASFLDRLRTVQP